MADLNKLIYKSIIVAFGLLLSLIIFIIIAIVNIKVFGIDNPTKIFVFLCYFISLLISFYLSKIFFRSKYIKKWFEN